MVLQQQKNFAKKFLISGRVLTMQRCIIITVKTSTKHTLNKEFKSSNFY